MIFEYSVISKYIITSKAGKIKVKVAALIEIMVM